MSARTHSSVRQRSRDRVRQLVQLAKEAAVSSDADALSDAESRLADVLARRLDQGTDSVVQRALERLDAEQVDAAADVLSFWADDAATHLDLLVTRGAETVAGTLSLFLVPLVLVTEADRTVPATISLADTLDHLATRFRHWGLIGPDPSLGLFPGLYRLTDLPVSWARRRQWLRQVASAVAHQPAAVPAPTLEPGLLTKDAAATSLHLRFLLGFVLTEDGDDAGEFLGAAWPPDGDANDDLHRRIEEWQQSVSAALSAVLPQTSLITGLPDTWCAAIENGRVLWNIVVTDTMLAAFLERTGTDPDQIVATVQWENAVGGWKITCHTPAQSEVPWAWVSASDPEADLHALLDYLHQQGNYRLHIDGLPSS